jgi:hypothetical protein
MKHFHSNSFFSQFRLKPVFLLVFFQLVFFFPIVVFGQVSVIRTPLAYDIAQAQKSATCDPTTSIDLVKFNTGLTYFQEGGISILIKPTGIFELNNQFFLELSDASGSFSSPRQLAVKNDFFIPALNGVIPNGIAVGTGYKLRVRSTNPAKELVTNAFSIQAPVSNSKAPSLTFIAGESNSSAIRFIKCIDSNNYFFGNVDVSSTQKTSEIELSLSDFDDGGAVTSAKIISETGTETSLTLIEAFGNSKTLVIPQNLTAGYYLIELSKTYGTKTSTLSFIFLFNTL